MSEAIRLLIVDDHVFVRKGIQALLATEGDIEVVGEAQDGEPGRCIHHLDARSRVGSSRG